MDQASISTRFTRKFELAAPVALAPMAMASGGALAAACARAGALGLIGGGYGDLEWTSREYALACSLLGDDPASLRRLGCGFITWKLDEDSSALDWVLDQGVAPTALMLSFGDPRPYRSRIEARGIPLICQVQTLAQLPVALEAGAQVIVAQGVEAGGHGMNLREGRGTFTLLPEVADWLARHAPQTLLLAAGGIADGRGLAAALVLGADGALVGSRLWVSSESLAPMSARTKAVETDGDGTARSSVFDILRRIDWPEPYDFRAIRNGLYRLWESRIDELRADPQSAREAYAAGVDAEDYERAHVTVGEAVGLIDGISSAASIIGDMTAAARDILGR